MKKTLTILALIIAFGSLSNAQTVPAEITKYLNTNHSGWKKAPGFCEDKKWALTADFNADKRTDYVVRFKVGKKSPRLFLFAFINKGGKYNAVKITEDEYSDDLLSSTFSIIKRGNSVSLDEEGTKTIKLKTDAVTQYICETDAAKTFIFANNKFVEL